MLEKLRVFGEWMGAKFIFLVLAAGVVFAFVGDALRRARAEGAAAGSAEAKREEIKNAPDSTLHDRITRFDR